jgi:hypothetical protein
MNEEVNVKMRKIAITALVTASLVLFTSITFAISPFANPLGLTRFKTQEAGELVVRYPAKAVAGKPFNIGIYISDNSAGGSDYASATMIVDVSGPEGATIVGWNSWFEEQGLFIDWGVSDLIVPPYEGIESFEHDDSVSKLGDVSGWTGSIVCKADTAGTYTFTIGSWNFSIDVA